MHVFQPQAVAWRSLVGAPLANCAYMGSIFVAILFVFEM